MLFVTGVSRKTRVLDVVYNASNNELVRTKTLVKNCVIQIDSTPFRQWFVYIFCLFTCFVYAFVFYARVFPSGMNHIMLCLSGARRVQRRRWAWPCASGALLINRHFNCRRKKGTTPLLGSDQNIFREK